MKLIAYSSWFRPKSGRDCGEVLLQGLERRGHEIAGVVGHHEDAKWQTVCHRHGWHHFPTLPEFSWPSRRWVRELDSSAAARSRLEDWLLPIAALMPDIGLSFYATWIPPLMGRVPAQGFVNFHPAPLPALRGYFPECLAILKGFKSCGGTLHRVTNGLDEGPVLATTRKVRITTWETPVLLLQMITEAAIPDIWRIFDKLAAGKIHDKPQPPDAVTNAGYPELYAYSVIDWTSDSHEMLHRKFQVFRGEAHRMLLKADWHGTRWTVWDWELHKGNYKGAPGDCLGQLKTRSRKRLPPVVVRTREGVCCIWEYEPYVKEEGTSRYVDQLLVHTERILHPGKRPSMATSSDFRQWRA